jgi:hypothetical protein
MPFLDELAGRIEAQGAGVLGQNMFLSSKSNIPSGNGPYISIIESGGTTSRRTQNNTAIQRPSAQITVRASSYPVARAQAVLVYDALGGDNGLHNLLIMGTFYQSIVPVQQIFDLGLDDLSRARVVFNINAEKQPS